MANAGFAVSPFCDEEDWQSERSVLEANRYMLENQVDCDVIFTLLPSSGQLFDDGASSSSRSSVASESIGCHRYALISRSPVFFAMLTRPLSGATQHSEPQQQHQQHQQLTKNQSASNEIRITDIAPPIFWQLLRYMYYEKLDLTEDSVFAVLYAAKKYLLTSLTRRCISYLESNLSPDNVCVYLENAYLFEHEYPALSQRCHQVIENQSKRVFHSESFFEISKETLRQVLCSERLSVHEVDVFLACLHWAERRTSLLNLAPTATNKRQMLGEALTLIHIPAMSIEEFTKIVVPSGLLSVDEENAIFRLLLCASPTTTTTERDVIPLPFPRKSRNFVATRCDVKYDEGFARHNSASSLAVGVARGATSFRSGWSLTFYCDHRIKVQEIGFLGLMKANVFVTQNGYRKLDVTSASPVNNIRFDDELELDVGMFTIGADAPFTYAGDYFTRACSGAHGGSSASASSANASASAAAAGSLPTVSADHDCANLLIRDVSSVGFLSYLVFMPTDEFYFIDNYYSDDVIAG